MKYFETAAQAVEWITGARWKGEKNGVENTRTLLEALGNPECRMGKILHVAGTNGKGSVSAFLAGALTECGYKTGLFTSPYLRFFNERIQIGNTPISDEKLVEVASEVREKALELSEKGVMCTTFELLTACACVYYAKEHTDFAVMEVGLGGRLDSTNVLPSSVSLIAAIGLDHMEKLGDTVEAIAGEKAGIMKNGVPCVVLKQDTGIMDVFAQRARDVNAPLFEAGVSVLQSIDAYSSTFYVELPRSGLIRQRITMPGSYQCSNAALALTALDLLGIDMNTASRGVENTRWAGRLDWRNNVLVDCAHNPQGALTLKKYLDLFFADKKIVLLTGMMKDKQLEACAAIFSSFAGSVITTAVNWPRAVDPFELSKLYGENAIAAADVESALKAALRLAGDDGIVVSAGSVYLAGDVINLLEKQ